MKRTRGIMLFAGLLAIGLIVSSYVLSEMVRNNIAVQSQELERIREAEEQATVSRVSVCNKYGEGLPKQEASSLFVVPKNVARVYICGAFQTSTPLLITIYLSQKGDAFTSTNAVLKEGPFIMDVIGTENLEGGRYRANVYIIKGKSAAFVEFLVER